MKMEYTKLHTSFLKKHEGMPRKELAALFNAEFGTHQSAKAIKSKCKTMGLRCSSDGRFQKGAASFNKGTKGLTSANKTSFQSGSIPLNKKEVGSITKRTDKNGYTYQWIKIAEPNKWQTYHAYLWEQEYGKIQKGFCVIFKDKNPSNTSLDNLMLVSRNELVRLNQKYSSIEPSLKDVALNVIKIQNEVIKRTKK
ncbi:MAG: hypothetical protein KU29_11975 [Sulfurovum sp. FS06-10]|nr:MAG: hypothetical protein KU29_11975 [Sulfurovum sp. FS06-10]